MARRLRRHEGLVARERPVVEVVTLRLQRAHVFIAHLGRAAAAHGQAGAGAVDLRLAIEHAHEARIALTLGVHAQAPRLRQAHGGLRGAQFEFGHDVGVHARAR